MNEEIISASKEIAKMFLEIREAVILCLMIVAAGIVIAVLLDKKRGIHVHSGSDELFESEIGYALRKASGFGPTRDVMFPITDYEISMLVATTKGIFHIIFMHGRGLLQGNVNADQWLLQNSGKLYELPNLLQVNHVKCQAVPKILERYDIKNMKIINVIATEAVLYLQGRENVKDPIFVRGIKDMLKAYKELDDLYSREEVEQINKLFAQYKQEKRENKLIESTLSST